MRTALKSTVFLVAMAVLGTWANFAGAASCVVTEQSGHERLYVATPPDGGDCYDYGAPNLQGTSSASPVILGNEVLELPTGYTDQSSLLRVDQDAGTFFVSGVSDAVPWILVLKQGASWAAFMLDPGQFTGSYYSCKWTGDKCKNGPEYVLSHSRLYGSDQYQPVPIPAAVWLLGSGLLGLVLVGRRRKTGTRAAA